MNCQRDDRHLCVNWEGLVLLFISAIMNISWLWNCLIPFATISRTSELIHFYKCINCLLPNCVCSPQGNPHVCCDFVPAMLTEIILLNNFALPSFQQTYVMVKPISFLNQRKIGSQYALESLTVKLLCSIFVAQSNFWHVMWIFRSRSRISL